MVKDQRAEFMRAYEQCHERFLRYCSALSFGRMEVEDLVQDVLLSAYRNFDTIRHPDKLLHYLIRAAHNRAISLHRRRARRVVLEEQQATRLRDRGISPEAYADLHLLYRALDRLAPKQKSAIVLFELSGFSIKEIAKIQQTSPAAVKMKLSRGRKRLRELLAPDGGRNSLNGLLQTAQSWLL